MRPRVVCLDCDGRITVTSLHMHAHQGESMTTVLVAPAARLHQDDSQAFAQWLTGKSFSMLAPMCLLGLAVVLPILLLVDPVLHGTGVWGGNTQHLYLVAWHGCAVLYFLLFLVAARFVTSHARRTQILVAFFVSGAALFSWIAFISWMLSGDLSTYAIFLLTMVCVFCFPGNLRKMLNVASAATVVLLIFWFDARPTFYTSGAAVNLIALAAVSWLLDGFLLRLNRTLYREMCRAEFERARADRVLYNALPMSIADELKNNNVVKAVKYPTMTVLFVDLVGFTQFSAGRAPDAVVQVLNDIFSEFDGLVDRYDVEKIKTIGDAYMVIGKGDVTSVASLALEMLRSIDAYNRRNGFDLAIRIGIHIGPTVAGVIGLKRFLYDVWGDAVNTASRMESMGESGKIHVSDDVFRQLAGRFRFEPRGQIDIKGKGLMRTYFLLGLEGCTTPA